MVKKQSMAHILRVHHKIVMVQQEQPERIAAVRVCISLYREYTFTTKIWRCVCVCWFF